MASKKSLHQIGVEAREAAVIKDLPRLLGISKKEFKRRMNAHYVWPTVKGVRLPQGDCSSCRTIDKRHPEGQACDFSCVGV